MPLNQPIGLQNRTRSKFLKSKVCGQDLMFLFCFGGPCHKGYKHYTAIMTSSDQSKSVCGTLDQAYYKAATSNYRVLVNYCYHAKYQLFTPCKSSCNQKSLEMCKYEPRLLADEDTPFLI